MERRSFLAASAAALAARPVFANPVAAACERMTPWLIEQRRDFHMHPELMYDLFRTSKVVADRLAKLGLADIRTGIAQTGVTGVIRGAKPGPIVAVRADMDALPIDESKLDIAYKSKNPGVKHACGHDAHTTIALGVAEVLMSMRQELPGTVLMIFQPAEEGGRGAQKMVQQGVFSPVKPEAIFGLHVWPQVDYGKIAYASGVAMAAADRVEITIKGKMSHGAQPENGIDTVVVAANAIQALQSIRSRRMSGTDDFVLSLGSIHGGTAFNIITDTIKIEGTMRTLSESLRDKARSMIMQTMRGVTEAFGATYEYKFDEIGTVTYNDPALVARTVPTFRKVLGEKNVIEVGPVMGAEDFSYFQKEMPGFFYFLGVRNEAKGFVHAVHTPEFDLDERALPLGVNAMTNVVLDYLTKG
jgi:amidohydrolase